VGWLGPAWEGGAPGIGFLCGRAGGEGGREDVEGLLTSDGERRMAGNGAAAGFLGGSACGGEGKVREAWMSAKEQPQVLVLHFYRASREERGSRLDVLAINGHGGLRPSMPSRGGLLMRGNGRNKGRRPWWGGFIVP
jgi:hypothetical protein